MHQRLVTLTLAVAISVAGGLAALEGAQDWFKRSHDDRESIQLGLVRISSSTTCRRAGSSESY